jgi:hypothetical protein
MLRQLFNKYAKNDDFLTSSLLDNDIFRFPHHVFPEQFGDE